jgi:hydroxyacylglutathione hydrolase
MEQQFGPVRFIPGKRSGRYPYSHSLYVEGDTKVLIDAASNDKRLAELHDSHGVDAVWLTHWHEDHFKYLYLFDDRELWISEKDAAPLSSLEAFFDAYGMNAEERQAWIPIMEKAFHFKPRKPHRVFNGESVIDLGGITIEAIPTPGHTPGHCALFFQEQGILYLGDYDLSKFGPWYGDRDSDIDAVVASVNRLRAIPAQIWITAHEQGVFPQEPADLWDKYLAVIDRREQKLIDILKAPRSLNDIVEARIIYGRKREPAIFYDFGERSMMGKHLERLIRAGSVQFDGTNYSLI